MEVDLSHYLSPPRKPFHDYANDYGATLDQICDYSECFHIYDTCSCGRLPINRYLKVLMQWCGEFPTPQELWDIEQTIDPQASGIMTFDMFLLAMSKCGRKIISDSELDEAFSVFDRDGSGTIESSELMHVLRTLGDKMTEEESYMMVAEADHDGNGTIDYQEFSSVILSNQS